MSTAISANRLELLQVADAVARDKVIDRELVLEAMEEAFQKAARSRYGAEHDLRAHIDRNTGEIKLRRVITCLAVWAAIRPKSIGGSSSEISEPVSSSWPG